MAASQKRSAKELQRENQLRLVQYKKISAKGILRKKWVLKTIKRNVNLDYRLNPNQLMRFCDNWFPVDSSLLSTKEKHRGRFYPLASGVQDDKIVLQIRNCPEEGFWFLTLENKWLPPGQFVREMQNLQWYVKW